MRATAIRTALVFVTVFASMSALAQQPLRVRGTIESVNGSTLLVKQGQRPDVMVKLTDDAKVFAVVPATLSDVKLGAFIAVAAMPQPDGSQTAIQVVIFMESQRGRGEGNRPWDRPGATMTNGTVDATVAGVEGQVLTVKYKGGEQKIIIGANTLIRTYVPGNRSDLKPGAHVYIFGPERLPDGTLQTARINVGRDGVVPQ